MNQLLQNKVNQLTNSADFECWYLVKHNPDFCNLCYLVEALDEFIRFNNAKNVEDAVDKKISGINQKKGLVLSNNYRALRVAAFLGLIKMTSQSYSDAEITDVYKEIYKKCSGEFEKTELYADVINRQVEKLYTASMIDEGCDTVRKDYRIYPVMFLYKVLVELGKVTGNYSISQTEYRYLVATTKKYEDYLETMLYIKLLRDNPSAEPSFTQFRDKFDNRMNMAIGLLTYLDVSNDHIKIKDEYVEEITKKVFKYENGDFNFGNGQKYIDFLCSTKSFFDTPKSDIITHQWFKEKGKEFYDLDVEANELYAEFKSKYGVDALNSLSGEDLLNAMFLGGNPDNLCHELEYNKRFKELFGSVKGGNAYKYPLFYDKENGSWMSGTRSNPKQLSLDEAIILGTSVRDKLVNAINQISSLSSLDTVEDYLDLYSALYAIMPEYVDSLWVIKYFHMIFPSLIPVFYNKDWQNKVLAVLKITPSDAAYGRLGQINVFVNQCEISNVVFAQVFHKYCRNIDVQIEEETIDDSVVERLTGGENIILYGVPGAGKSWTIKHEYCSDDSCIERLVFHPDYTYSDFVGQIMPKVSEEGSVSYEFTPGPFTKLVRKAYLNPDKMFYLVIEEVNRGNAPAIFGDVFQLLDRQAKYIEDENKKLVENPNYGASEYEITNADVARIVYGTENHKVSIPSNMSILCTMNTSDQNVFTLDTAFQRRWNMRLIENSFKKDTEEDKAFAEMKILDTNIKWEAFCDAINEQILEKNQNMTSSEDKRLGTHFVTIEDLTFDSRGTNEAKLNNGRFPEKVIKYLWDDAFKFYRDEIFKPDYNSLGKLIKAYVTEVGDNRFNIFKDNIKAAIEEKNKK